MAGRLISLTDPDLGTIASSSCTAQTTGEPPFPTTVSACYYYDPDGNLLESVDPRGSAGTIYNGYDGIDRRVWQNTTNTSSGAFNTYCYDNTAWGAGTSSCSVTQTGNYGIGRLTGEAFKNAPDNTLSGSATYTFDARGRQTQAILAISGAPSMTLATTFDDADVITGYTYPDGEPVSNSLSPQDWLTGVNTVPVTGPWSGFNVPLLSSAAYAGSGGASGLVTGATFNFSSGSDNYTASYDLMSRPTDLKLTRNGTGATDYEENLPAGYDAAGNIPAINITLAAGTDHQAFCYDEQNRLTAAASSGTVPCESFSSGTLIAANYNQTFAYDNMGRLTSGPLGAYTYGASSHVHGATAIGSTYTAAYDAAGNMTCRNTASTGSVSCSSGGGTVGAVLGYNAIGQMSTWQNQASNPTSMAKLLYDGQGHRVEQVAVSGSTTTTTVYAGQFEQDASVNGGAWSKTTYYYGNGQRLALATNGNFYHLVTDLLSSSQLTFDANGNLTASVLYAPYGGVRYGGSLPTDRGFTGQIADTTSGLDYYNARYYDPVAGQFASADTVVPGAGFDIWGLSPYAYVEGDPVTRTDPSGHCYSSTCWSDVNDPNSARVSPGENVAGGQAAEIVAANGAYEYARAHPQIDPQSQNLLQQAGGWVSQQVGRYEQWVRDHEDGINLISAGSSIGSGILSFVAAVCEVCAPVAEPISAGFAGIAIWADTSLFISGRGSAGDVILDAAGLAPGLGIWRADAKITKMAAKYASMDKRFRDARALKALIATWKAAKQEVKNADLIGAVKDIAQGAKYIASQYLPQPRCPYTYSSSPIGVC